MATPKQLVAAVSQALRVPEGTVIQHDRNLALAGLRGMAGRGRAVSRVTFQDAANLLIAVAASPNVKDSVATVIAYGELGTAFSDEEEPAAVTFGEGLTNLLGNMAGDERVAATVIFTGYSQMSALIYLDAGLGKNFYFGNPVWNLSYGQLRRAV